MRARAAAVAATAVAAVVLTPLAADGGPRVASVPAPGRLDQRFGAGGIVRTGFAPKLTAGVRELLARPDGKTIAVGTAEDASSFQGDVAVVRYLANGALDTSFGKGGKAVVDTRLDAAGTGAVLQRDGKLLVVGAIDTVTAADRQDLLLIRLRRDGTLDPSFGRNGIATADLSRATPDLDFGFAVAVQRDGRIIATGQTNPRGRTGVSPAIVRFRADGRLDGSFGIGGVVVAASARSRIAQTLLLQAGGRFLIGGDDGTESGGFVARVLPDGRFDNAFGTGGFLQVGRSSVRSLLPTRGGGFVAVGTVYGGAANAASLTRFGARGRLDRSFGTKGRTETPVAPARTYAGALAGTTDARGRILIAGGNGDDILVARYSADGHPDSSFGGTGVVTLDLGGGSREFARAVRVRRDGTIVAAGASFRGRYDDVSEFALVRLTGTGSGGTRYASLDATNVPAGVRLRWVTAPEQGTRAFAVYRTDDAPSPAARKLLTRVPIPARGRPGRYEFLDRDPPSYTPLYWLQEIRRDGSRAWFGPITPPSVP